MSFPTAPDKKIQKLSNMLAKYVEQEGVEFCFGEQPVYAMETFAHFGCLSLFLLEAKDNYEKIFNNLYTTEELFSSFGRQIKTPSFQENLDEAEYLENQPKDKLFPIEFHEQENDTYFGFIPRISEDIPADFFMLAHFTQYTVEEYIKQYKNKKTMLIEGRIPLDILYEKLEEKINAKRVTIIPAVQGITPPVVNTSATNVSSGFDN
jgi:hypothetical protein